MKDLSTKAVLGRAALIGLVTGIPTALIWADTPLSTFRPISAYELAKVT
ncbi:hypothetical protein [Nonomuraea sp. NPDC050691]